VNALIRIDADRSCIGKPEGAARKQPILKKTANQAFAQLDLQGLDEPALRHVEDKQYSRDDEEHAELKEKIPQVAARQSVVEWLIPSVEANLPIGRDNDDQKDDHH